MASTKQIATALLTEHLRYTPLTLIDDIINTVNELTNRAVDAAENGLLGADPDALGFGLRAKAENREPERDENNKKIYPEARLEIEEGVHKLETLLESNIDKNFDKFEILALRGILSVPEELVSWIRLAHYEAVGTEANGDLPTTESLEHLLKQVQETKKLKKALKTTITRNSAIINQLQSLTAATNPLSMDTQPGALSFLAHNSSTAQLGLSQSTNGTGTEAEAKPLTTNVAFALSQLPALQSLLAELRPQLDTLNGTADTPATEADVAKERRQYVETQSRRAMERQGIAVGSQNSEVLGKIPTAEELAALEDMVDGMND